jgi:hypothetical protein
MYGVMEPLANEMTAYIARVRIPFSAPKRLVRVAGIGSRRRVPVIREPLEDERAVQPSCGQRVAR